MEGAQSPSNSSFSDHDWHDFSSETGLLIYISRPIRSGDDAMHKAYEKIVDRLIRAMENGIIPWRRPWVSPMNAISKKPYRGINFLMLATAEYADPRYVTFLQAKELGGSIKQGAKGYPVVKWHFPTEEDRRKNPNARPWAKGFTVFNVEQCENLRKLPELVSVEHDSIAEAQSIIDNWAAKPETEIGGFQASYNPMRDQVCMPEIEKFQSAEAYYDTYFHELTHSTGHVSRLNRGLATRLNKEQYGLEELIAEIGGAMLDAEAHIDNTSLIDNNAAYLQSWLRAVKNDPGMIPKAASMAAKAVDLIMGRLNKEEAADDTESAEELMVAA